MIWKLGVGRKAEEPEKPEEISTDTPAAQAPDSAADNTDAPATCPDGGLPADGTAAESKKQDSSAGACAKATAAKESTTDGQNSDGTKSEGSSDKTDGAKSEGSADKADGTKSEGSSDKADGNGNDNGDEVEYFPALDCYGVEKSYGGFQALRGVTLRLPRGRIMGLLGPSGSGKTTFMKIIAGLLSKDSGDARVCGMDIGVKTKGIVSYLPDRCCIPEHFTVSDAIEFYEDFFPDFERSRAEAMLDALLVKRSMRVKSLSKGTREKLQLILVMSRRARLYLLDEPISGVDPATRDYILGTVIRNFDPSASIIISTHLISEIERIMDSFVFLREGRVFCIDTPEELKLRRGISVDEYFREVFRC